MNARIVLSALQLGLLGIAPVLFLPFVVRILSPEIFPKLMLAQAWIAVLSVLVQFGLHIQGPVDIGRSHSTEDRWRVLVGSWQVRALLFLLSTILFVLLLSQHYVLDEVWPLFMLLILPAAFWFNAGWYLQAIGDFRSGALGAAGGGLFGGLCIYLALHEPFEPLRLLYVIGALAGPQFGSCAVTALVAFRDRPKCVAVSGISMRQALVKGLPTALTHLAMVAYLAGGTIVVAWFDESDRLSAYAATEKLFNVMSVALALIYSTPYPTLAAHYMEDVSGYWKELKKILRTYFAVAGVLAVGILIAGPQFFRAYLGENLAIHAIPVLPCFALWLILSVGLHAAVGHVAITGKRHDYAWLLAACLSVTFTVGYFACTIDPTYWVAGLLVGQLPPLLYLFYEFRFRDV